MAFKRFSARKNLSIDLGISALISFIQYMISSNHLETSEAIARIAGGAVGIFFTFFIWSWRTQYVQSDKLIKVSLHTLFISTFIINLFALWLFLASSSYIMTIYYLTFSIFMAVKYKRLFWPKKPEVITNTTINTDLTKENQ